MFCKKVTTFPERLTNVVADEEDAQSQMGPFFQSSALCGIV
jgi:hypothetical protein